MDEAGWSQVSAIYVTQDGDWGDSSGIEFYSTTGWSPLDFDIVDSCRPSERQTVALGIEKYRRMAAAIVAARSTDSKGE